MIIPIDTMKNKGKQRGNPKFLQVGKTVHLYDKSVARFIFSTIRAWYTGC